MDSGRQECSRVPQNDLNDDGLITADELRHFFNKPLELTLKDNRVDYNGTVEKSAVEHRGKRSFKVLTMKVIAGKTYQIDMVSPAFQSFLFLEDSEGNPLHENSSPDAAASRVSFSARIKPKPAGS